MAGLERISGDPSPDWMGLIRSRVGPNVIVQQRTRFVMSNGEANCRLDYRPEEKPPTGKQWRWGVLMVETDSYGKPLDLQIVAVPILERDLIGEAVLQSARQSMTTLDQEGPGIGGRIG